MLVSDTAVKRPVFAVVISLLLVAFGLVSFERLPLREYPDIDPPIVSIRTNYLGASAAVVESRVTQLIEDSIAGIEGIKTITSSSADGLSAISIEFNLSRDIESAANDVRDRVSGVMGNLPQEADAPEVQKSDADERVIMWLNLTSQSMDTLELTDYAERYLVDRFSTIDGVARVRVSGGLEYAMRIWLDRKAMAARGLTATDIENALRSENVELPAGTVKSVDRDFIVKLDRNYLTEEDFQKLVVGRGEDGYLIRLKDVARVELGAAEWRRQFRGNGINMVGLGIIKQSTANTLSVTREAKKLRDRIRGTLPEGMDIKQSFDSSVFVESAISEVYSTLFIAAGLVVLVILLFLGDWRAMMVPAVTVPVSLIATFTVLYGLGYSLNLLTLLALVLAIGMVVDDGIVVLENIHRRIQEGESPLVAAYRGARQVGFAVVATTLVLIAVFIPITFLRDDVGRLFGEFAIAMATAVGFSSVVALTLSPVICARLLKADNGRHSLSKAGDRIFNALQVRYQAGLKKALHAPLGMALVLLAAFAVCYGLFKQIPQEFAPKEDRGVFFLIIKGPEGASFDYTSQRVLEIEEALMPLVEGGDIQRLLLRAPRGFGGGEDFSGAMGIIVLSPFDSGRRDSYAIMADARARVADISGVSVFPVMPQALGGHANKAVQFVIGGADYDELARWRDRIIAEAQSNPGLVGLDSDYQESKPQLRVSIDRERAASLGVQLVDINRTLETLLGSRRVTTFMRGGEEYDVILEGEPDGQRSPGDLHNIYVRSVTTDRLIPLSNLITLEDRADAATLNRFNRMRAITIDAAVGGDYTLGEALAYMENLTREIAPEAVIDYKGESLKLKTSSGDIYFIFALALMVVFLVMAAQFESFIHPLVIMLTVPLAVAGALIGLYLFGQSINIYSQVALIMLVGLATKNGILIVEFANQLRDEGMAFEDALLQAAGQRLRPILMTSITTIMGAVPLILASGAGAEARFVIGIVVSSGVSVATLLTLFVVPLAYALLARNTHTPQTITRQLEAELQGTDWRRDIE
ncbi:efflux RND transporter permease subunit [Litorivivens sp.]|uniref:efflux RND transporter permease subunit n=2 Tax=Litorivivens sp. TaxID=2020868 RepID=UPI003561A981